MRGYRGMRGELLPAAGRDLVVAIRLAANALEQLFESIDVVECAGFGNVATVEEDVDPHAADLFGVTAANESEQMLDMAMHVAIGQESDEVHRPRRCANPLGQLLPHSTFIQGAGGDCAAHQLRALVEDEGCRTRPTGVALSVDELADGCLYVRVSHLGDRPA